MYQVKQELCRTGFYEIWLNPFKFSDKQVVSSFTQRVKDNFIQEVRHSMENSSKCYLYRHIVDHYDIQFYLTKSLSYKYRNILSKYRLQSHSLSIETGRYNGTPRALFVIETTYRMKPILYCYVQFIQSLEPNISNPIIFVVRQRSNWYNFFLAKMWRIWETLVNIWFKPPIKESAYLIFD